MKKITYCVNITWLFTILFSIIPAQSMMIKHINHSKRNVTPAITDTHQYNGPQKVVFKLGKDIGKYKKLLENRELIKSVLSRYEKLSTVPVGIDDSRNSSYAWYKIRKDSNGDFCLQDFHLYFDSNWLEDEEDIKQFIAAHEASHIACSHWKQGTIQRLMNKYPNLLTCPCAGLIAIGIGLSSLPPVLAFLMDGNPINEYILHLELCFAPIWIIGIAGLSALQYSLKSARQNEQEADLMAAEKLQTADGGIKWCEKKIHNLGRFNTVAFTHPSFKKRLAYLKKWQSEHDTHSATTVASERE